MAIPDNLAERWDIDEAAEERQIRLTAAWNEPHELPSEIPSVPAFDPELLPESLRDYTLDIAERIGCPVDFVAVSVMVALSATVGRQVAIRPNEHDDWTVIPNLWGGIVSPPGALKSPAMSEALKPLEKLEAKAREEYEQELAEYMALESVAKQQAKVTDDAIRTALKNGNEAEAQRIAAEARKNKPEPPKRKRYITQDATVEKLGELLAENPNGMLISRDELTGWLRAMDKQGHESDRAFYLEAWNGDKRFTYDRIGRGTRDIDAACVSILGTIQPGPLQSYVNQASRTCAGADGLLQRFQLLVWPDPPRAWEQVDRRRDEKARAQAFEIFEQLAAIDPLRFDAECDNGQTFISFISPSLQRFREFRTSLENRLLDKSMDPAINAVLAKQRSLVPSLALLIHLADSPEGGPVQERATLKAIAWAGYLEQHARRIFGYANDSINYSTRQLAEKIKDGSLDKVFKKQDIYLKHWSGLNTPEKTEQALNQLVEMGWVRKIETKTGGRPSESYRVNPKVMTQSQQSKIKPFGNTQ